MHATNRRLAHQAVAFHMHLDWHPVLVFIKMYKFQVSAVLARIAWDVPGTPALPDNSHVRGSGVGAHQPRVAQPSVGNLPRGSIGLIYHLTCMCCLTQSHSKVTTKLQIIAVQCKSGACLSLA